MSKISRTKGATFEREVVAILKDRLNCPAARNLDQVRDGGSDIKITINDIELLLECKRRAAISVYPWLHQAQRAVDHNLSTAFPVVVARADREAPIAIISLQFFLDLVKGYKP